MPDLQPNDAHFAQRVRESFQRQAIMQTLGAQMVHIAAGEVHIRLPFRADLTQQHGYLHAGIVTTIVDSACGYAASTLMPPEAEVLSVEFKINLLSPAVGDSILGIGQVMRHGRTITVCRGDVWAQQGENKKLIAIMQATMIKA